MATKKVFGHKTTCRAIDALIKSQICDIFSPAFGYITFIEDFAKRLQTLESESSSASGSETESKHDKQDKQNNSSSNLNSNSNSNSNSNQDPNLHVELPDNDKPLLILDIDNTILFVRFFADEIAVDDDIHYFEESKGDDDGGEHQEDKSSDNDNEHENLDSMEACEGIVTAIWYNLTLEFRDDDIIDELGTDIIEYDHCHVDVARIKKHSQFEYPYRIDSKTGEILETRMSTIKNAKVTACEIEYDNDGEWIHKYISFEENSSELNKFQPALQRDVRM